MFVEMGPNLKLHIWNDWKATHWWAKKPWPIKESDIFDSSVNHVKWKYGKMSRVYFICRDKNAHARPRLIAQGVIFELGEEAWHCSPNFKDYWIEWDWKQQRSHGSNFLPVGQAPSSLLSDPYRIIIFSSFFFFNLNYCHTNTSFSF